jgi:hypothetical protein
MLNNALTKFSQAVDQTYETATDPTFSEPAVPAATNGGFAAVSGVELLIWLIIFIVLFLSTAKIFQKAGQAWWKALIPVYNMYILMYILLKIVGRPASPGSNDSSKSAERAEKLNDQLDDLSSSSSASTTSPPASASSSRASSSGTIGAGVGAAQPSTQHSRQKESDSSSGTNAAAAPIDPPFKQGGTEVAAAPAPEQANHNQASDDVVTPDSGKQPDEQELSGPQIQDDPSPQAPHQPGETTIPQSPATEPDNDDSSSQPQAETDQQQPPEEDSKNA